MKYTNLTKEQHEAFMLDFEFRTIFNKIAKLKTRLEKRKQRLLDPNRKK